MINSDELRRKGISFEDPAYAATQPAGAFVDGKPYQRKASDAVLEGRVPSFAEALAGKPPAFAQGAAADKPPSFAVTHTIDHGDGRKTVVKGDVGADHPLLAGGPLAVGEQPPAEAAPWMPGMPLMHRKAGNPADFGGEMGGGMAPLPNFAAAPAQPANPPVLNSLPPAFAQGAPADKPSAPMPEPMPQGLTPGLITDLPAKPLSGFSVERDAAMRQTAAQQGPNSTLAKQFGKVWAQEDAARQEKQQRQQKADTDQRNMDVFAGKAQPSQPGEVKFAEAGRRAQHDQQQSKENNLRIQLTQDQRKEIAAGRMHGGTFSNTLTALRHGEQPAVPENATEGMVKGYYEAIRAHGQEQKLAGEVAEAADIKAQSDQLYQTNKETIDKGDPVIRTVDGQRMYLSKVHVPRAGMVWRWSPLGGQEDTFKSAIKTALKENEVAGGGPAGAGSAQAGKAAENKLPSVGAVVDGHRFKGGNPAEQKNWEKI